ncbi:MAG TPA: beta-ketoacyl-ACP synthase III [Phycisphaerales bacterium]|nr:beta-ketoacyl-ACP synthase III [Phycisphaerales bacterium]
MATPSAAAAAAKPPAMPRIGVRILGSGSAVPKRIVSNDQIAALCGSDDDWIFQRTGIRNRHICNAADGESNLTLCTDAARRALEAARVAPTELDLLICGTITQDMRCPSTACLVASELGCGTAAAWDLGAACCGFVYALNTAHDLIRTGSFKTAAVIGCDTVSAITDYTNRNVAILFGDAAGAVVLRATDDASKGVVAQCNHANGNGWQELFVPGWDGHIKSGADRALVRPGCLHMNGREVFKFAVTTFCQLIQETLDKAGLTVNDVDLFVCHQSNVRILEAASERFGIDPAKLYKNIERYGNTSAGSVPLCFDELRRGGKIEEGQLVLMVAFGAGLTWSSSLWRM